MKRRHFLAASLVALTWLAGVAASSARAETVPLSDLLKPGSSIATDNGLVFDGFTYTVTNTTTTTMPSADKVQVSTTEKDGNFGIEITGAFTGSSSLSQTTPKASLSYRVSATSGLITDIHLSGDPMVTGGHGTASVTESFPNLTSLPTLNIFQAKLTVLGQEVTQTQLSDSITAEGGAIAAPGLTSIAVKKDISVAGLGGVPQVSVIDQTYSIFRSTGGGTGVVPEPSSVVMMGTGCLCVLGSLWRRRRITA